jgi:hypothetical protein
VDPGGAVTEPVEQQAPEPPPEEASDGPVTVASDDLDGGDATLDLVVDPDEVAVDGEVAIAIRKEGEAAIGVGREAPRRTVGRRGVGAARLARA